MKKANTVCSICILLSAVLCSCHSSTETTKKFIETANMDSSVKPGDNFFLYVNGKWLKTAVIPPSESGTGAFLDVYNVTKDHLHMILDSVSKSGFDKGSVAQQTGDFYTSGMDTVTIEKLGYEPVKPVLAQIAALTDAHSIMQFAAHQATEENNLLIDSYIGADDKNSSMNIAAFFQTGLGLPDRDYYFKSDAATEKIQKAYQTYIQKIFILTGDDSATAAKKMTEVYGLEKDIAASHRTNVQLRDPQSNYNKRAIAALDKEMPLIGWKTLFDDLGYKTDSVNISQPMYYTRLNDLLKTVPADTWKAYLHFHTINNRAGALSTAFVNARFSFIRAMNGSTEDKPRWERIYWSTDRYLGDALGQLYVKRYFTDDARKRMLDLVDNLQKAFEARINKADWMSDSTKKTANDKLHTFLKKIGYTNKWRDYSKVNIDRSRYYENIISCAENDYRFQVNKLGKKVDRTEWGMTAPTVNAYYNATHNEIVFPAGILQLPFFDPAADDAINYGGIGAVIGHEMTHGFDDQGSQYDKDGNLKNWWSKKDSSQFVVRTKRIVEQYNGYTVLDTMHINGALTTGENSADLGGINIAYDAFKLTRQGKDTVKIDGFTPDQRFFISFAQVWKDKQRDESTRAGINLDPHSPAMYRVNGPLSNFDAFYRAFNIQSGDKMYKPDSARLKIW